MRPPKTLKGEALAYWKRNAPLCEKMGTLTKADTDSFTLLCAVWARLVMAEAEGAGSIEFVCLAKQYQNLSKPFGLDPISRKKLNVTTHEETPDEFGI